MMYRCKSHDPTRGFNVQVNLSVGIHMCAFRQFMLRYVIGLPFINLEL